MPENIAIRASHLGKQYRLGEPQEQYLTFRDVIVNKIKAPLKAFDPSKSNEMFWALKDVSFDVEQGDVVGIIGRNGAGKSTLLKILSRITTPTEGTVELYGRVGSLLEVGTGFHPEMTGRENIYLNGSILGMKKLEIDEKFDEIVRFSEIEKFLDTPVKRYSSGMYVRLAFAVAAHLDPEILLVDEVLAVGDAQFQKKCLGKMGDVAKEGRTVLFVSHNMNAVEELCNRCILLEGGKIIQNRENVREIINKYIYQNASISNSPEWINNGNQLKNPFFQPIRFFIADSNGHTITNPMKNSDDCWILIEGKVNKTDPALQIGYAIYNDSGHLLYWSCFNDVAEEDWVELQEGDILLKTPIPKRFFNQGFYRIEMIVSLYFREWLCEPGKNAPVIHLHIHGGLSDSPYWLNKRPGLLAPVMEWILVNNLEN